jgi:copper transport protein
MRRSPRVLRRSAALAALAAGFVVLLATPAFAHAVLLQTTPGEGAVLTTPPKAVSLRYDEQVTVDPGGIRVYDTRGNRVDTGSITNPSADVVSVAVHPHLADGAYVVTWRVISADTHPVQGAFTFQVGLAANATAPNVTGLAQQLLHKNGSDATVGAVFGVVRGVLYTGIALLIGAAAFAVVVFPRARGLRRTWRLVWSGWALAVAATISAVFLQGTYGAGLGLGDLFRTDLIRGVLGTQFGHLSILRLVLLAASVPLLRLLLRRPDQHPLPRWWSPTAGLLAVAVALTFAFSGHAHTGDLTGFAVPADVIHILAMSLWLGGLATLAYAVFPGRSVHDLRDAVPRFSRLALGCVAALVVTGSFQAWRQVGSIHALRDTDYGHLLMIKVVIILVLLVVAAMSRQIVGFLFPPPARDVHEARIPVVTGGADDDPPVLNGHRDDEDEEWEIDEAFELRRLRWSVYAEVVIGILVIAVTAMLVNAAPAKVAAAQRGGSGAAGITLKSPQVWVDFSVVPGVAPGANDVHVTAILPSGAPTNLDDLTVTMDYPSRHIAPLEIPLRRLGPGHYLSPGFTIPFGGNWRLTAHALLSQFNEVTLVGVLVISS